MSVGIRESMLWCRWGSPDPWAGIRRNKLHLLYSLLFKKRALSTRIRSYLVHQGNSRMYRFVWCKFRDISCWRAAQLHTTNITICWVYYVGLFHCVIMLQYKSGNADLETKLQLCTIKCKNTSPHIVLLVSPWRLTNWCASTSRHIGWSSLRG